VEQVAPVASGALPVYTEVVVQQPQACETYYNASVDILIIDQHNRLCQANLALERKVKTTKWWCRVNMSIFGMCVVDAYLLMKGCCGECDNGFLTSRDFYNKVAKMLIDNRHEQRSLRELACSGKTTQGILSPLPPSRNLTPTCRPSVPHPSSTKRRLTIQGGHKANAWSARPLSLMSATSAQGEPRAREQFWIYDKPGKKCMGIHIHQEHPCALRGQVFGNEEDGYLCRSIAHCRSLLSVLVIV
jgi:hypothetical protein